MRLLQVINALQSAGAEVLLKDITLGLAHRGFETVVYLLRSTGAPLEHALAAAGIRIYRSAISSVRSPRQGVALARHLRAHRYDVIHAHLFPAQLWVALAARLAAIATPLVTTEHSSHNRRRRILLKRLDGWMYRRYTDVACVSQAVADSLGSWIPEIRPRLSVIPDGIDVDRFATAKPSDQNQLLAIDGPIVMMVGRLDPEKDQATLLRALRHLDGAHGVLVGDGSKRSELEQLAARVGIADRTHFLGSRDDVERLLKRAVIYVQSSHWEGFGIAALEAMASGVPVVASRIPGLMDVVNSAGVLFEPGNAEELAQHLRALLADPARRAELAKRGRACAEQFRIERTVERYGALYRETCGVRRNPRSPAAR